MPMHIWSTALECKISITSSALVGDTNIWRVTFTLDNCTSVKFDPETVTPHGNGLGFDWAGGTTGSEVIISCSDGHCAETVIRP